MLRRRGSRSPGAIDAGNDAVWAVFGDATLARIDPKSSDVERTDAGQRPTGVVEGGDWLWVVSSANSTVYRFSPRHLPGRPARQSQRGPPVDRDRLRPRRRLGDEQR